MSEEMAVGDNASGEQPQVKVDGVAAASAVDADGASSEQPSIPPAPEIVEPSSSLEGPVESAEPAVPVESTESKVPIDTTESTFPADSTEPTLPVDSTDPTVPTDPTELGAPGETLKESPEEDQQGIKRKASTAFSEEGESQGTEEEPIEEHFKGFEVPDENDVSQDYSRVLERLEAEVVAARKSFTPVRTIMASPSLPLRASKRPRQDTDGSRPSSALSSRSEGDALSNEGSTSSPAPSNRRRATTEMSSPLLRVPMERGWKRELVYRAALDAHSRRNADIYYYTPQGKKLRSTREVAEHLGGTGLTLDNFSFFKEPLGLDDPEKEIIRDAKLMRRVESPVAATAASAATEGKRTPKPKLAKGASPDPPAAVKSPPAKIRVKSVGSRLSNNSTPTPTPAPTSAPAKAAKKTPAAADNNNSAAWKKPRQPCPPLATAPPDGAPLPPAGHPSPPLAPLPQPPRQVTPPPPPPLQSRPPTQQESPDVKTGRQVVQPCSLTCGRGVPTLSCAACLCMYHPACAGYVVIPPPPKNCFYCKNCRKSTSPPLEPPPLVHKSGVTTNPAPIVAPVPRRVPVPVPVPVPVSAKVRPDKRVLLRMKVAGGGPDGERVWAVAKPPPQPAKPAPPKPVPIAPRAAPTPRAIAIRATLPQSLAIINGRRFIIVPRSMVHTPHK